MYFMHYVLHDWADEEARKILNALKPALAAKYNHERDPTYSKLLIHELVLPSKGASWKITARDWDMMNGFSSGERTALDWQELLQDCGYQVTGIWTDDPSMESLIEATLA